MGKEVEDDDDGDGGKEPSSTFKKLVVPDQSDERQRQRRQQCCCMYLFPTSLPHRTSLPPMLLLASSDMSFCFSIQCFSRQPTSLVVKGNRHLDLTSSVTLSDLVKTFQMNNSHTNLL